MRMIFSIGLIIFGCLDSPAKGQNEPISTTTSSSPGKNTHQWPKPTTFIQGIPIYENFSQLEPLFHFNNDTTYVINFWATWCKPCLEELPYLEKLTNAYGGSKIKVVLISLDFPNQFETKLVPFVEKQQLRSTVIALADGGYNDWIDKVTPEWSGGIPATYIYKGERHHFIGSSIKSFEELQTAIKPLL